MALTVTTLHTTRGGQNWEVALGLCPGILALGTVQHNGRSHPQLGSIARQTGSFADVTKVPNETILSNGKSASSTENVTRGTGPCSRDKTPLLVLKKQKAL